MFSSALMTYNSGLRVFLDDVTDVTDASLPRIAPVAPYDNLYQL